MLSTEIGGRIRLGKRPSNLYANKTKVVDKQQEVTSMLYISNKAPFLWISSRRGALFRAKKISLVLIYAWLFMNSDPGYNHRVVKAMMFSRAYSRHPWFSPLSGRRGNITPANSLSTIETIALIQAINSNRGSLPLDLNGNLNSSPLRQLDSTRQQLEYGLERQLGPPLPRAAVVAAIAAFFAAVASGLSPFAAVAAAASAAAAALLAIIIILIKIKFIEKGKGKGKEKSKPLIKKLVIKKTILPVVVPIVIKSKKEEEKYYKIIKKPEHKHKSKAYYKYKKVDRPITEEEKPDLDPSLKQIEYLLNEQNKLQSMVDNVIKVTESDKTSNKSRKDNKIILDRRMGTRRSITKRKSHSGPR